MKNRQTSLLAFLVFAGLLSLAVCTSELDANEVGVATDDDLVFLGAAAISRYALVTDAQVIGASLLT